MVINTSTINEHVYFEILDNVLIPLIINWFGDDEVVFQYANASCHRTKEIKAFLLKMYIEVNDIASKQSESISNGKFRGEFFFKSMRRF